jgi:hypothetical protein
MTKVKCPVCGAKIELVEHPRKPGRVVGYCNCERGRLRGVIECDAQEESTKKTPAPRAVRGNGGQSPAAESDPA